MSISSLSASSKDIYDYQPKRHTRVNPIYHDMLQQGATTHGLKAPIGKVQMK
jgi:hypothetical protein